MSFDVNGPPVYPDYTQPNSGAPWNQGSSSEGSENVPYYPQVPEPPKPALTANMHWETRNLLWKAHGLAHAVLDREITNPPAYNPESINDEEPVKRKKVSFSPSINFGNIDFSDRSWHMLNAKTEVRVTNESKDQSTEESKKKKKEEEKRDNTISRLFLGTLGLIVVSAAAYLLGKTRAEGEEAQELSSQFTQLKENWEKNKNAYPVQYRSLVDRVVRDVDIIMHKQQTERTNRYAVLFFSLFAAGITIAGAVVNSKVVMRAGIGMGLVAGGAAIYKASYNYFSKIEQKQADEINLVFSQLNALDQDLTVWP